MKRFILLVFTVFLGKAAIAQSQSNIKPLSIGDQVPNMVLSNIINYPKKKINLYDLKGKLVIFDFFATWCSSCIAALPELNSLQEQYRNKIQVFVVTYERSDKIKSFLRQNQMGREISLPFITSDTLLKKFFPHQMVPHEVWISPSGVMKATTAADQVNKENIMELLAGDNITLRMKNDVQNFTMQQLFFFNKNIGIKKIKNALKYYSIVSGYIPGIGSGMFIKKDTNGMATRVCFTNSSLIFLYKHAFNIMWPDNRCIINIKDHSKVKFPGLDKGYYVNWAYDNAYCYEFYITTPISLKNVHKKMQQDLKDYFGYNAGIETRNVKCLVLTANKKAKVSISRGGDAKHNFSDNNSPKFITNQPISKLVDYLNYSLPIPVLDETNCSTPVDMQLPKDLSNIDSLKAALRKYGFKLKECKKMMDVFVLSDK